MSNLVSTGTGQSVDIPISGTGPVSIDINVYGVSGIGYQPLGRLDVEYTNLSGVVTKETAIVGGSWVGGSVVTIQTGALDGSVFMGQITVTPSSITAGTISSPFDVPKSLQPMADFINGLNRILSPIDDGYSAGYYAAAYNISTTSTSIMNGGLIAGQEYDPGWLTEQGLVPYSLPPGLVPIYSATGQFTGIDIQEGYVPGQPNPNCFPAGTMIDMWPALFKPNRCNEDDFSDEDIIPYVWQKPIEDIACGDVVLSYDDNGKLQPGKVVNLFENTTDTFVRLDFPDNRNPLFVTPGHAFLDETGSFTKIGDLLHLSGNIARLIDLDGQIVNVRGTWIKFSQNTSAQFVQHDLELLAVSNSDHYKASMDGAWITHNFEVEKLHTYVAHNIRVHNDSAYTTFVEHHEDGTTSVTTEHFDYDTWDIVTTSTDGARSYTLNSADSYYTDHQTGEVTAGYDAPTGSYAEVAGTPPPVILDLDGDGIEIETSKGVFFDVDGDGYLEQTAWAGSDDGFLVIDLKADGTRGSSGAGIGQIDQAKELVLSLWGEEGWTDLETLARATDNSGNRIFDVNGDNVLNSADGQIWNELKVWQDLDQDGETEGDSGELRTLAEVGISEINLVYDNGAAYGDENNTIKVFGSSLFGAASYTKTNGEVIIGGVGDVALSANMLGWKKVDTTSGYRIEFEFGDELSYRAMDGSGAANENLSISAFDGVFGDGRANELDASGVTERVQLLGAGGNDTLTGGNGSDWISGGDGVDHVFGGGGDDVLFIDAGDIQSGSVHGGTGIDTAIIESDFGVTLSLTSTSLEAVVGAGGDDHINGAASSYDLSIQGRGGNDTLSGGNSDDVISGDDGDDQLHGDAGGDLIFGGSGIDAIYGGDGDDLIVTGDGDDWAYGHDGDDLIQGQSGNDVLSGEAGDDWLDGGAGNDSIHTGAGDDIVYAGEGDDFVYGGAGDDMFFGGAGNDDISTGEGDDWLDGGDGADILRITGDGRNYLNGGTGADIAHFGQVSTAYAIQYVVAANGSDNDVVFVYGQTNSGGWGKATILRGVEELQFSDNFVYSVYAEELHVERGQIYLINPADSDQTVIGTNNGGEVLAGGYGHDTVYSHEGSDFLYGHQGDDELHGWTGDDSLYGGSGQDTVNGQQDNDHVEGMSGRDFLNGDDGEDSLHGQSGADQLIGGGGDDLIAGGGGADLLFGSSGNDYLAGEDGEDVLKGGGDNDTLDGGEGRDILYGEEGNDLVKGGNSSDRLYGGDGDDTLWGELSDDWLDGGTGSDTLDGGYGDDRLYGDEGHDLLLGAAGRDALFGDNGNDQLNGGIDNDWLNGGQGDDTLTGGSGADYFVFDVTSAHVGDVNVITDFSVAEDQIRFLVNEDDFATAVSTVIESNGSTFISIDAETNILSVELVGVSAGGMIEGDNYFIG